jgi:MoxR-like ATPase
MDMNKVIKALLFTPGVGGRWGLPFILKGKPGSAKSAQLAAIMKSVGLPMEVKIGSLSDPTDFGGLPFPSVIKNKTEVLMLPASFARRLDEHGRGVCFLDELNTAADSVFAAMLRMILEGVVGELQLPPGIRFVAAMNSVEDAAGGRPLPPPMANRFGHFEWVGQGAEEWSDWALSNCGVESDEKPLDAAEEEARVMELWPVAFAKSKALVAGFVRKFPGLLMKQPEAHDPASSGAFPTMRTWEMAMRAIAGAEVHGLGALETNAMVTAFVGTAAAAQFIAYRKATNMPDPIEILDGKVKFEHDERQLDRTITVLSSCAAIVCAPNVAKRDERADRLWVILGTVLDSAADVAVPAVRALVKAKVRLFTKQSEPVLTKLNPLLVAAGLIKKK